MAVAPKMVDLAYPMDVLQRRFMVPVDGSPQALLALQHALNLSRPDDEIMVVTFIAHGGDRKTAVEILSQCEAMLRQAAPGPQLSNAVSSPNLWL
jgi:hypothetical protein